jgi:hypothetical protein
MTPPSASPILQQRLRQQHLSQSVFSAPEQVVDWLGAVQAQDYLGAKWALGLRMRQATDAAVEAAFTEGTILRTHVMRPTWHFVTPADIRWLLGLTAPRVNAASAYMYRRVELDEDLFARSNKVLAKALQGGRHLTRAELGSALAGAGIVADGVRLGYIVLHAELDAVVCSGPRRGKQFTYALLDERIPPSRVWERDEALAELTRRYFTGHGPATVRDFTWWSGLTVADARAGIDMSASHLTHEIIEGRTYWFATSMPTEVEPSREAYLLPAYDEFLVGFASFDQSRKAGQPDGKNLLFNSTILCGGQVIGSWKRTFTKEVVAIELSPFAPLSASEAEAVGDASRRYGAFLGKSVTML